MAAHPPFCIALIGPTATGKTHTAMEIAARFRCEIISVDAMLVYKGMDIGTAKPSVALRAQVPHHLIDICDLPTPYSAALFARHARVLVQQILSRGRIPFFVGGTMLYFHALQAGLSTLPSAHPGMRAQLQRECQTAGLAALYAQLVAIDPVAATRIHAHDKQRIVRALEVYRITGMPFSQHPSPRVPPPAYAMRLVVFFPQARQALYTRIEQRFEHMLLAGWEEEVMRLLEKPHVHPDLPALRAVGYRQMVAYLSGQITKTQCKEMGIQATRRFAKRQLTWLRHHWMQAYRIDPIEHDAGTVMARCIRAWGLNGEQGE